MFTDTDKERFWSKVHIPDLFSCWEWQAGRNSNSYGVFWVNRKLAYAHRIIYQLMIGSIPDNLTIDHLCRNKRCVNPSHIELVTIGENVRRNGGPSAQNAKKESCLRGHKFTSGNTIIKSYFNQAGDVRYKRSCRTCKRQQDRKYDKKRRRKS